MKSGIQFRNQMSVKEAAVTVRKIEGLGGTGDEYTAHGEWIQMGRFSMGTFSTLGNGRVHTLSFQTVTPLRTMGVLSDTLVTVEVETPGGITDTDTLILKMAPRNRRALRDIAFPACPHLTVMGMFSG